MIQIESEDEAGKLGAAGPRVTSTNDVSERNTFGQTDRQTFDENGRQTLDENNRQSQRRSQEPTEAIFKVFAERSKSLKGSKDRKESKKVARSTTVTFYDYSTKETRSFISEQNLQTKEGDGSPKVEREKRKSERRNEEQETNGETETIPVKESGN